MSQARIHRFQNRVGFDICDSKQIYLTAEEAHEIGMALVQYGHDIDSFSPMASQEPGVHQIPIKDEDNNVRRG